ncbi:hypothetical protein D9615_004467 [Tricholomella constricta]|uniref:HAT C-terminal dimerisation domain-containing protein n=1 Tax=Tricholomella constricta TaxID=117010 RepID=A0A8H5M5I7_9AGAR|nr:hypothetical protein D9615_004467 [Tricholomella constricta]
MARGSSSREPRIKGKVSKNLTTTTKPNTRSTTQKRKKDVVSSSDSPDDSDNPPRLRSIRKKARRDGDNTDTRSSTRRGKAKSVSKGKAKSKAASKPEDSDDDDELAVELEEEEHEEEDEEEELEEELEEEDEEEEELEEEASGAVGDDDDIEQDLNDDHAQGIPNVRPIKKDRTRDILTIFGDREKQSFVESGVNKTYEGRWCLVCKAATEQAMKDRKRPAKTLRACFLLGANSTLRGHIMSYHFDEYERRCQAARPRILINERCIPPDVIKAREAVATRGKGGQTKLGFVKAKTPKEFSREEVVASVTRHIAIDNQALMLADKISFRNVLVSMRPIAKKADLPTSTDVRNHLHNSFVERLKELKAAIEKAPGKVSCTADGWTADTTKQGYLGMTAHWISVSKSAKWTLRSEVVGFRSIYGNHSGANMGRYFMGLCDRIGITSRTHSKLHTLTLDNTSSNNTFCTTIESQHRLRNLPQWCASENQLPCLEHVVNLANVDVMSHITRIAALETASAIWEYDPSDPDNRVLGGSLDVIATIRTLAIKLQSSGQRIQYFEELQLKCNEDLKAPLKIPLHSNTRWGSAYKMLERAYMLRAAINLFVMNADSLYGPITTIRQNGSVQKKLAWRAFALNAEDWERVKDAMVLLADSNRVLHHFSAEQQPTLYRALPALEDLQTVWEAKRANPKYHLYHTALQDGLDKLSKYYSKFDDKPWYILAIVLHPYFKLNYIKMAWGGAADQEEEFANGNLDARNWQDEAQKIVEKAMQTYWKTRRTDAETRRVTSSPQAVTEDSDTENQDSFLSEFDRHRRSLISQDSDEEWQAELRRYLSVIPVDVTRDTDLVNWWQRHAAIYPTLAQIALDVLPSQASSVPCERVFSSSKLTATDRRSRLKAEVFEELQLMKATWRPQLQDLAKLNSEEVDVVNEELFGHLFDMEREQMMWDTEFELAEFDFD